MKNFSIRKCHFLVLLITILVYLPTLWNQYNLDDEFITLNKLVTNGQFSDIPLLLSSGYKFGDVEYTYGYRPLSLISYNITYALFGDNVFIHHLLNLIFYLICVSLCFQLLCKLLSNHFHSFLITLLFSIHPIHSEVVANLKSRDILFAYLFFFLCLNILHIYIHTFNKKKIFIFLLFLFSVILSYLSHPISSLFLPFYVLFYILFEDKNDLKKKILNTSILTLSMLILVLGINFIIKNEVSLNPQTDRFIIENPYYYNRFCSERYLSSLYWWVYSIGLSFFPLKLIQYYGFGSLLTWPELSIFYIILTFFVIGLLFINAIKYLIIFLKKPNSEDKLIIFAFALFFGFTFAQSNIYRLLPGIIAERWIFLAGLFPIILILILIRKYIKNTKIQLIFLGFWIVVWSYQSFTRSQDWYDKKTTEAIDIKNFPNNAKLLLNSGSRILENYKKSKKTIDYELAKKQYLKAVEVLPQYAEAYNNLGVLEQYNNKTEEAIKYYKQSIKADSNYFLSTRNLALIYSTQKDTSEVLKVFTEYIYKNKDSYEGYNSLIQAFIAIKNFDKALEWIDYGIINCSHKKIDFLDLKGGILWDKGLQNEAISTWGEALKLQPENKILIQKIQMGRSMIK